MTPGARRLDLVPLEDLGRRWRADPGSALVVSDVHSALGALKEALRRVGAVDEEGRRLHKGRLVQVGDLIDGRDGLDLEALAYGLGVFDEMVAGNHEGAYLGGKAFHGRWMQPDLERELSRAVREGRLDAAAEANGVLIVHGGAHPEHWAGREARDVAQAINEGWVEFFHRRGEGPPSPLFDHTPHGGRGGASDHGGALWCDWRQLVEPGAHSEGFRQIVGHSPLASPEASEDGRAVCIDVAGRGRLGLALVGSDGDIEVGILDGA